MSKVHYREEQRFNQWWIWLILLFISGLWIWQFVQQIFMGIPFGNNPAPDVVIYIFGLFPLAGIWFFKTMTLETLINEEGVQYRFKPFQRKFKLIKPKDILHYEVKKYSPIKDYGGWGIRYGMSSKGNAYNVKGNDGVFFELNNRKKFLLGTQNPASIKSAMEKLMNQNVSQN